MPKLLLNLRLATDDEAAETRELLDQHNVDWYETQPGFWGISAGGIWLRDLERAAEVKALLKQYQSERLTRVRAERAQEIREGRAPTFLSELKANPGRMLMQLLAVALLIGLTVGLPYVLLAK
ncbi:MAG: DUF6164 family protein [Lysobacterales bacterium]|nr:hypothetical protein [Xanthomonadales bacterium]